MTADDQKQLQAAFLSDAEENISTLEALVLMLESDPSDGRVVQSLFRAAHTLKGNASCMGFESYTTVAHAVEEILDQLRSGRRRFDSALATLLLRSSDVFRQMTADSAAGVTTLSPVAAALLDDLHTAALAAPPLPSSSLSSEGDGSDIMTSPQSSGVVRVELSKLDRMLDLVGEISLARGRLARLHAAVTSDLRQRIDEATEESEGLFHELQQLAMTVRLVAVGPLLRQQTRTIRDLAQKLGKAVHLNLDGEEVGLDAAIVERLREPLTHLIRNAVDHGIETPERRRQAGKHPTGELNISVYHRAGDVVIEVSDDGHGLDRGQIEARASQLGLEMPSPDSGDWRRVILLPGFTTAEAVNDVSGRGVGLDVVEKSVRALRGTLGIDSGAGSGTTFTLRVPLTLAIVRGLCVGVGGESYVIPIDSVNECADLRMTGAATASADGVLDIRGEAIPFIRLRHFLGCPGRAEEGEKVVIVETAGGRTALVVDELRGETEVVVKPLASILRGALGLSGSTVLPWGDIGFILEPLPIVQSFAERSSPH